MTSRASRLPPGIHPLTVLLHADSQKTHTFLLKPRVSFCNMELSPTATTEAKPIRRPTMMPARNTADFVLGLPDYEDRGRSRYRPGSSSASYNERPASIMATSMEHYEADLDLLFGSPEEAYCLHIEDRDARALVRQGKRSQLSRRQGSDILGEEQTEAETEPSLMRRMSGSVAKFGASVKHRVGSLSNVWRKDSGAQIMTGTSGAEYIVIADDNEPGRGNDEPLPSRRGASITASRMFGSQTGASDGFLRASGSTAPLLPQQEVLTDPSGSDQASPPKLSPSRRASLNRLSENHAREIEYRAKNGDFNDENRGKWFEGAHGQDPDPERQRRASALLRQQTVDDQKRRDEQFQRLMNGHENGARRASSIKDGFRTLTGRLRSKASTGVSNAGSHNSESRDSGRKSIPLARQASGPAWQSRQSDPIATIEAAGQGLIRMPSVW